MEIYSDIAYWIAISHLPGWKTERINQLVIKIQHEKKLSWADFFMLDNQELQELFDFTAKEFDDISFAKTSLPRTSLIAKRVLAGGFLTIPIVSPEYPLILKHNLKLRSPTLLYTKGEMHILKEEAIAIVGSRQSTITSLNFTDLIARNSVLESKVVVSGFAKGVDKQALDSALMAKGKSIIVLPQGILTFHSGLEQYHSSIGAGDLLILSTFHPEAAWDVGLAMARNAYIYGLATEIYIAESNNRGGTWQGAIDGLKKGRKIYVRLPLSNEKNANLKLIEQGCIPVNMEGSPLINAAPYL